MENQVENVEEIVKVAKELTETVPTIDIFTYTLGIALTFGIGGLAIGALSTAVGMELHARKKLKRYAREEQESSE